MANTVRNKRGSGSDPSASDLVLGEIAVRTDTGQLFVKKDDGSVASIAGGISDGDKGDITVSNSGATFTIDNDAVTYAKIQNVSATNRILGRDSSGAGVIEEITPASLRTMLNVEDGATADQSASEIKSAYESNSDTNAFTDALLSKLNGIAASATNVTNTNQLTNGAGFITATLTNEQVQDIVGGMVSGNTETGITVTYQDSDGTLDFAVASQTDNNFTTTLKNKLDGIAASATNVTNNNQISNGAGYVTSSVINSLNASNLSSGTIPDARFPSTLPAIDGSNLTGISAGATGGGSDEIFYENGQTVTTNYTITNGKNAMSAGPITINSGVTVTVGAGETLTIV